MALYQSLTNSLYAGAGSGSSGFVTTGGNLTLTDTTVSTSTDSGALIVSGGVGIGGDLTIAGDVTVTGTVTGGPGGGATKLRVSTAETTTSLYPVDIATVQAITITTNTAVLVNICCNMKCGAAGQQTRMGFATSGATTIGAGVTQSVMTQKTSIDYQEQVSGSFLLVNLTPGVHTFTAKFGTTGGATATFKDREIAVIPLN